MSLKPVLEIGVWNAWILALFLVLHPLLVNWVDKVIGTGNISQKMGEAPASVGQKIVMQVPMLLLIAFFILAIFLPLRLDTFWFYFGLLIYLFGIAVFLSAIITAARTPIGQIFSEGIYRYSRHPLYLSFLIIFVGISTASASWLFLLLSLGWMAFPLSQVTAEEKECLKVFGVDYQEYKQRTPKWLGLPRSK